MVDQKFLDDYDWQQAFFFASPDAVVDDNVSTESFGIDDVDEIIAAEEGENDGDSWLGVFKLKDGRYAMLDAWCDYTGWDCQSGGTSRVASSLDSLIRFGLTNEQRDRLNLEVKGNG